MWYHLIEMIRLVFILLLATFTMHNAWGLKITSYATQYECQQNCTDFTVYTSGCTKTTTFPSCVCIKRSGSWQLVLGDPAYKCSAGCYLDTSSCKPCNSGYWSNNNNQESACTEIKTSYTQMSNDENLYCTPSACQNGGINDEGTCIGGKVYGDVQFCRCKTGYYLNKGKSVAKSSCEACPFEGTTNADYTQDSLSLTNATSKTYCVLKNGHEGSDETGEYKIMAKGDETCPWVE